MAQLVDIYGTSSATTIMDNCDVRIAYRVNHWDTLTEFSRICGEREVNCEGHISREPLITQSQLAAMETGQALVIISGRVKFITWIPDFTEMYPQVKGSAVRKKIKKRTKRSVGYFDVQKYVKEKKMDSMKHSSNPFELSAGRPVPTFEEFTAMRASQHPATSEDFDVDDLIKKIDAKIAEFEEEESAEGKKNE